MDDAQRIDAALTRSLGALRPPPKMTLAEWAEANLRLPADVTANPGRLRLIPYQRAILDSIGDPNVERVTFVKCVRIGYTMSLTAALAAMIANDSASTILLLPTEEDCRNFARSDLDPLLDGNPEIGALLAGELDDTGRSTLLARRFAGGSLKIIAARSPARLRAHTARVLIADEIDAMEQTTEGNPLRLAERRTLSFSRRKIVMGSTPTYEGTSNVLRLYGESDRRIFEVPCPSCGAYFELQWRHIEWEPDRPETAHARCPHCEDRIDEAHKGDMVASGTWTPTAPEIEGHHGYRLNALVSPLANAAWPRLVAEFLASKHDPALLQPFVNTILAEGWREVENRLDEHELASRAEPFGLPDAIPPEVLWMTAGVDVQHDRLEIVFVGHSSTEAFVLGQSVIWGDAIRDDSVWSELDAAIGTTWKHPRGGFLRLDATAVDAGDGQTHDVVMRYCTARLSRRVFAIRGVAGNRPVIEKSKARRGLFWAVGVDSVKGQIANRLTSGRSIRFSADLAPRFFEELTSERLVVKMSRGQPVRMWERVPGRRAESLDCVVYALAARSLVGSDVDGREAQVSGKAVPAARPTVSRSKWLDRR